MKEKPKKHSQVRVRDAYATDAGLHIKNKFVRTLVRGFFHRRARGHIRWKDFSLTFSGAKLRWYFNFLNDWYGLGEGKVACFFTEEGAEIIAVFVEGDSNAKDTLEMPKAAHEYIEAREKEKSKKGTKLEIDWDSLEEDLEDGEFRFHYEGTLEEKGAKQEYFEYTLCEGFDKVVLRAIIPAAANPQTISDVQIIAKSLRMKV